MPTTRSFRGRLSIVMPTADYRLEYFRQSLWHLRNEGFDGDLLVLDFGKDRLDTMGLWSGDDAFNVRHFYYGPDIHYMDRMLDGARKVDTPLVLFYPDDDFIFFDVVEQCAEKLEADPEYSVAQGKVLRFNEKWTDRKSLKFEAYQILPVEGDSPMMRLRYLFGSYNHHIYVVTRRELFIRQFERALGFKNDGMFFQYFTSGLYVIEGKAAVMPSIFMLRRVHDLGTGYLQYKERDRSSLPWLILADDFTAKFRFFREQLMEALAERDVTLDQENASHFELACISIMRWGLCGLRAKNEDKRNLPHSVYESDEERKKLVRIVNHIWQDGKNSQ